jgi:hypothetical protein
MGLKQLETSALPETIVFACAMRMPLLASASILLVASDQQWLHTWVGFSLTSRGCGRMVVAERSRGTNTF